MSYARSKRISEEIKKIVSGLLMNEIKDPRISKLTTVTDVETTRDLRFTYIYVSIFDNDKKKLSTIEGLNSAKGYVRKEIGTKLNLRYTPEPIFKVDESMDNAMHINSLINKVAKNHDEEEKDEEKIDEE